MSKKIASKTFQLVKPGVIEEQEKLRAVPENWVVVQPTLASVCHADLRYYTGNRRPEALKRKLPMALLHEGIGLVTFSKAKEFQVGERVVIVPNIPGEVLDQKKYPNLDHIPVNYTKGNQFLGSGYDGIAQSQLVHPKECLVKIPDDVPDEIAVLCELCTVSHHAISHIVKKLKEPKTKVALFGDGPVGYLTAAMIHFMYGIGKERFTVFGADEEKLAGFYFTNHEMVQTYDFAGNQADYTVAIECTGGKFSESAINQAIDILAPTGDLVLLGVSEQRVPINTRDILEKGLTLYGSSRSSTADFKAVIEAMKNADYIQALRQILPDHYVPVNDGRSFNQAMDDVVQNRGWKKTVMAFTWE